MSTGRDDERELLAAEYALGVLTDVERAHAETLARTDPDFAAIVDAWNERLSPMLAEIADAQPAADSWDRLNASLDRQGERASNVTALERRLSLWRGYAAVATAAAAALLLVIGLDVMKPEQPVGPPAAAQPRQPVLVANVAAQDRSAAFVVSFDPGGNRLLVTPVVASPAPGHDHELWVIPATGAPRSLGLVRSLSSHTLPVPQGLAAELRRDATIAISVEPVGGSSTGQPTGPVVATGKMTLI